MTKELTNQQVKETANSVYVLKAAILQLEKNLAIKELLIENKVSELIRIHKNTLWYSIGEKKANMLGERMNELEKEIEELRLNL